MDSKEPKSNQRELKFTYVGDVAYYLLEEEVKSITKNDPNDPARIYACNMPGKPMESLGVEGLEEENIKKFNGENINSPNLMTNDGIVLLYENGKWYVVVFVRPGEIIGENVLSVFGSIYRSYGDVSKEIQTIQVLEWDKTLGKAVPISVQKYKHTEKICTGQLNLMDNLYALLERHKFQRSDILYMKLIAHIGSSTAGDLCKKRDAFFTACVVKKLGEFHVPQNGYHKIPYNKFIKLVHGEPYNGIKLGFNQDKLMSPFINHNPMIKYFRTIRPLCTNLHILNKNNIDSQYPTQDLFLTCTVCYELAVKIKKCKDCKNIICGVGTCNSITKCPSCRKESGFDSDQILEKISEELYPAEYLERNGIKNYFDNDSFE